MARKNDEVQRLNREVALERLVVGRGVELAKRGAVLVGRCPLCADGELEADPKTSRFRCSCCKAKSGVVDWVMAVEGVSMKHAVELLRDDVLGEPAGRVVRKATIPKLGGVMDHTPRRHRLDGDRLLPRLPQVKPRGHHRSLGVL